MTTSSACETLNALDFLMDDPSRYVALAVAIHGLALVIVNLTPTPKDNAALSAASKLVVRGYRVIELLAGIVDSCRVKR